MIWERVCKHPVLLAIGIGAVVLTASAAMRWPVMARVEDARADVADLTLRELGREREIANLKQKLAVLGAGVAIDEHSLASQIEADLKQLLQPGQVLTRFAAEPGKGGGRVMMVEASASLDLAHGSAVDLMARLARTKPGWFIQQASLKPAPSMPDPRQTLTITVMTSALRTGS